MPSPETQFDEDHRHKVDSPASESDLYRGCANTAAIVHAARTKTDEALRQLLAQKDALEGVKWGRTVAAVAKLAPHQVPILLRHNAQLKKDRWHDVGLLLIQQASAYRANELPSYLEKFLKLASTHKEDFAHATWHAWAMTACSADSCDALEQVLTHLPKKKYIDWPELIECAAEHGEMMFGLVWDTYS